MLNLFSMLNAVSSSTSTARLGKAQNQRSIAVTEPFASLYRTTPVHVRSQ